MGTRRASAVPAVVPHADTPWEGDKVGKEGLEPGDLSRRVPEPAFMSPGATTAGIAES